MRGHKSTVCKNAPGKEWNLNGEKTFKKPEWWDSKIPDPALNKQKHWPLDKRLKSSFGSSKKSSDDPMGFLAKLRKKAKFFSIIDECIQCNHCNQLVKVNPESEKATEKIIIQAFYRGVNDNPFLA